MIPIQLAFGSRILLAALLVFLPLGASATSPTTVWPDEPASMRMEQWLRAFNAEDEAVMRRFVADAFSPETLKQRSADDIAAQFRGMRGQTGALTAASVTVEAGTVRIITAGSRPGLKLEVTGKVDTAPPHHIRSIGVRPMSN